jgi:uncharacterized glyoxalase superfamily protein PhnB
MATRSAPRGTIIPSLIYDDVAQAIDWLCDVFGFKERLRMPGGDERSVMRRLQQGKVPIKVALCWGHRE